MRIHKDKKLKLIKKEKNNTYLRRIVNNLHFLKAKMSRIKNKRNFEDSKVEIDTIKTPSRFEKKSELWQSYQEFIGLFKNSPEALVYTDLNGIVLDTNKEFEKLTGFNLQEVRGRYFKDLLHIRIIDLKKNHHHSIGPEMEVRKKDGTEICLSVSFTSNWVGSKELGKILLLKNITNYKKSEEVSNVLYNISKAANSDISLEDLYPVIQNELHKIIDASNFYIALFNEKKNLLQFCYYVDETGKKGEDFLNSKNENSDNIFCYIFKTGQTLLLNYNKYKKMMREGHFNSHDVITNKQTWLGVPLKVADKIIGSMVLQNYINPKLYSQKDIKLMEFVSQQIASAITRKQTGEKLKTLNLHDHLTG